MGETSEQVAHSLAFLQMDLTDTQFREHARRGSIGFHDGLRALVTEGIAVVMNRFNGSGDKAVTE